MKTFKDNDSYFKWYNKNKDDIKIVSLKIVKDKIRLEYERL